MAGVAGVIGYLSFQNGKLTVNTLASQLRTELTARILQQIEETIERPYVINQINVNSFLRGDIDVVSGKGEHQLWQQAQVFPSTNLIYCATEKEGAFLGVGRSQGGTGEALQAYVANADTDRYQYYYEIDTTGQRSFLRSKSTEQYDPRRRPWYTQTKQAGKPTWSQIYLDFNTLLPVITANTPVYDNQSGELLGICATDVILSEELNNFLGELEISQSGIAFIIEPSGSLVASSIEEPTISSQDGDPHLPKASESQNSLIQATTQFLKTKYELLEGVDSAQLNTRLNSDRHYVETVRFNDDYGLDWIVVLVIPESDFMAQINRNTRLTILLCVITFLATLVMGLWITRWLSSPLRELSAAAQEVGRGEWSTPIDLTRTDVIGDLSRSFSAMTQQLQTSFRNLESRIEERTFELVKANQELQLISHIDGLTQVANRRYFDRYIEQEWHRLQREQQPISLVLCDVDRFKQYNDHYGHQEGDRCLQRLAYLLTKVVQRPADLVARYGGEEFILLLSDTDSSGAITVAQNILDTLNEMRIPHAGCETGYVSVSLGIGTAIPRQQLTPETLLAATDLALYEAKERGRNQYIVADSEFIRRVLPDTP
ncbi:MAG: diguanylate cyclase domain-containing protein [Leptolyngbyaceae cyanobacterium]